ncbi:FAD-dependent oxidoreductase [Catenuloplanes indicus]|uniref:2-polyprenyl-6-methoxyphenol hydroxylase-like FAD-dependent oxidoreductase n=1 Tax=Catenuloplanes indicus TaxID=137267 RepID=A0AAE3VZN3_9ACTN|nr:NAD(P)/FAD-dependent oxidoreductase [Catenuloplanes indicus]MDQ0366699.1 2-polyprenyl-6-methoxyphenol hydroxylase-like FAD-dependent oxidoreductase [Catenuloplanes indicus]
MTQRVGIVGAGIGGLTLAHALTRRGVDCVVYDRDAGPADTAGYRLHLTEDAFAVLAAVLPESSVRALRACGAGASSFRRFTVLDHRGRPRLRIPITHDREILMIGRRPLRTVLARGLDSKIRWGTPVTGFDVAGDSVTLSTGDEVSLLVAADGTGSRIAARWVGRPTAVRSGIIGIAGRSRLPQRIPPDLRHGLAFMLGPGGIGAFLALHDHAGDDPAAEDPYLVWSVAAPLTSAGPDLTELVHRLTARWTPDFHTLVDRAEPGSVAAFPFYFPAALQPWPPGPVTLLGDAIHPMPPTAGAGAGTAILDAAHLAHDLATGDLPAYQPRLLTYAPPAVDEARPALRWQRRLAGPLLYRAAIHLAFPMADTFVRMRTTIRRRPRRGHVPA